MSTAAWTHVVDTASAGCKKDAGHSNLELLAQSCDCSKMFIWGELASRPSFHRVLGFWFVSLDEIRGQEHVPRRRNSEH